ncbi:unnamed protein product [Rotaria sordida]|uniref:C2 domain-containing protein n=1 Tax=Rotaria sordida TaxID=392033 RepID=A0A813TZY7_9BILA|nr:unnamed protein product [Rotaria sordida]CAF0991770.1 unnamed protein product [Rotaria sordida]CAF1165897.1 unnamed protein product [Rotaria sordida]CAF1169785.1 unnamed protein product [Rotaria sordida]CAF4141488.1 unnamed protein product [Rotaria sordida]
MAQLEVTIIEGRNLIKKDKFSQNDAFIEIYFDDKKQKQKTNVIKNSNNPIWNQSFVFNHLRGQDTLHIDVYDQDTFNNQLIGFIHIDLHDLYNKGHIDDWFYIEDNHGNKSCGQIHISLYYQQLNI